jgi:hypothetical protein
MPYLRGAEPISCHRHCTYTEKLGQLEAIGSTALEQSEPTQSYQQHCFRATLGQLKAIGSTVLGQL